MVILLGYDGGKLDVLLVVVPCVNSEGVFVEDVVGNWR